MPNLSKQIPDTVVAISYANEGVSQGLLIDPVD
jgi:hypothetical protein